MPYYIFARNGSTALLFDIALNVKPERCTCSQWEFCKITEAMLQNINRIELSEITILHVQSGGDLPNQRVGVARQKSLFMTLKIPT